MREEVIGNARLILGDCRDVLPTLSGVDAVITDPPYFGVKSEAWDNQWPNDAAFLEWVHGVACLLESSMAFNASLYWFASPQMAARVECVLRDIFAVKNNITWDKTGGRKGVAGTGIDVSALRCFWSASSERIIFAEKAASDIEASQIAGYEARCQDSKVSVFGDYLRAEFTRAGVSNRNIAKLFPSCTGRLTGCVSNWLLGLNIPTPDQYHQIRSYLCDLAGDNFLRREYESLRREYESLRREYESLRRPFFLTPSNQWGDVWQFALDRNAVHPTQKPLQLLWHIVSISTRPHSLTLDPFMGSGTTGVVCVRLGRPFIGIELDSAYFDTACRRIEAATRQADLFVPPVPSVPMQTGDMLLAMQAAE